MPPKLVLPDGRPLRSKTVPARARADGGRGMFRSAMFPYRAAELQSQELGLDHFPIVRSPDGDYNIWRDRIVARSRDLIRNDGHASGAVDHIVDNIIGPRLRLHAMPDYQGLAALGCDVDLDWANKFRKRAEAFWRAFADDPCHYNDVERQLTANQQLRLALRHRLIDGENILLRYWMPDRIRRGGAKFATCYQVVDPDRLSNPLQQPDTRYLRGGVEIDDFGVPLAYHMRRAHQNDVYNVMQSMQWDRIEREDPDGWERVIHDFDRNRAGQNRGVGIFTTVLSNTIMLGKADTLEQQAAAIQATLGLFIASSMDPAQVEEAVGGDDSTEELWMDFRQAFYDEHPVRMNGSRVPILPSGDEVKAVAATHASASYGQFRREMQRTIASAIGISTEDYAGSYDEMNYSSARASERAALKTINRRAHDFATGTATPMYGGILEEAIANGYFRDLITSKMPDFIEGRTFYTRCDWMGPGAGMIDPVKEAQGSALALDTGLTTLKDEIPRLYGRDWEECLEQRAIELRRCKELGIEPPQWLNSIPAQVAAEPEQKPRPQ